MESDGKRLYSVLTRAEVRDKMMKEIVQISEVFSLSQSDATVALIRLGWDSFRASDLLGDDKERFLSGLQVSNHDEMIHTDGDGDTLVSSTPLCSHKFCSDCWRDHLDNNEKIEMIETRDCVASVGPGTIEKLSEPVKEMYERYVLGSFMDSNKIKWCPAEGCEYAVEHHRHEDPSEEEEDGEGDDRDDFGVVCLCGHTFCWRCKLESHRPVTCNNASFWLNELLDEAKRLTLLTTKPCPHCDTKVQRSRDIDWRIVTCVCSYAFCWRCLIPEDYHRRVAHCFEVSVPQPHDEAALDRHLTLWEESQKAVETAQRDLEAIERNRIPILTGRCGLGELDMRAVREACTLIVQCRLVLKWCSVFGYFITDYHSARKQYLNHLVEGATENLLKHKGRVDELVKEAVDVGVVNGFRHKIETSTTATGNYFHVFVKTVEEGLRDVKAGVYENVPTDYWFCDRCTFQNEAFERKCRVCVFPFEGPSPPVVALGNNSNGTASSGHEHIGTYTVEFGGNNNSNASGAHQQGVPNMSSNNPFAREGGTNVFESAPVVGFGDSNGAQVPNMSNNPFASSPVAFGNNYNVGGASVHQQKVPNMANNPFASPGGTFYGNNSIGASDNNPFASREGPIFSAYPANGYNSGHQVPNMADNPFARPGGTNPLQSTPPPFVGFGSASGGAHQQQAAPNMVGNNPPPVGLGSASGAHEQVVKEEADLGNSMESE